MTTRSTRPVDPAHARRRGAKKTPPAPRSGTAVLVGMQRAAANATSSSSVTGEIRRFKCVRCAGRNVLIGETLFVFGADGVCSVDTGVYPRASRDIPHLLRRGGVVDLDAVTASVPPAASPVHRPPTAEHAEALPAGTDEFRPRKRRGKKAKR